MATTTHFPLDLYTRPGAMTDPGRHGPLLDALPAAIPDLARAIHGLYIHEHIAPNYGVTLTDERRNDVHIRPLEARIDRLLELDPRPLTEPRPAESRLVANCRHYTTLLVAILRRLGTPARARCGFGAYFEPGLYIDHWVAEYWDPEAARWVRVDAQIDTLQEGLFHPDFDLFDVPHDRFVVAGDAWNGCRTGQLDPSKFGIMDMNGLWFIGGNLVRDAAALNNMEMLPWDCWGATPLPGATIEGEDLAFLDRLASLTLQPGAPSAELRDLYANDNRLRVPAEVFNAVLNRPERV